MVARLVRDQEVVGSNPVASTNKNGWLLSPVFLYFCIKSKKPAFAERAFFISDLP